MNYESVTVRNAESAPGVQFEIARISFGRRLELMRRIRELAGRIDFLAAGESPGEKMDAALLQFEIDKLYVSWGLRAISGLEVDGAPATPETLAEAGPEKVFREALAAVKAECGLSEEERKN